MGSLHEVSINELLPRATKLDTNPIDPSAKGLSLVDKYSHGELQLAYLSNDNFGRFECVTAYYEVPGGQSNYILYEPLYSSDELGN